jgi:hypothetical protein
LALYTYFRDARNIGINRHVLEEIRNNISDELLNEIQDNAYLDKVQDKAFGRWEGYLQRHYRLFQSRNSLKWLFSNKINLRLKLARIKNLLVFGITLNRKSFATELKHMRNEVMKTSFSGDRMQERQLKTEQSLEYSLANKNWQNTPVFIICRDRVDSLLLLLKWLDVAKMKNIILIDNDSLYPPLLKLLNETKHQVIKTQNNIGHTVPWNGGIIKALVPDESYILTDPDVIPTEDCPLNVVEYLFKVHRKHFAYQKIGLGLRIDDLPDHYTLKDSVITWEEQFWKHEIEPGLYESAIDTTFALYKPYTHRYFIHTSLRTGFPYVARHMPWYTDSAMISEEEGFYRMRASGNVTTWNSEVLGDRYKKEMKKLEKK